MHQGRIGRTIFRQAEAVNANGSRTKLSVWKTRLANGYQAMGIVYGGQKIHFVEGEASQQHAAVLRDLLTEAIAATCPIPEANDDEQQQDAVALRDLLTEAITATRRIPATDDVS